MNRTINIFLLLLALSIGTPGSYAFAGWETFSSDHEGLKGLLIVDIGEFTQVALTPGAQVNERLFRLNSYCFTVPGYVGFGDAAMLLVGENSPLPKLAIFDTSLSDVEVKLSTVALYKCP